MKDYELLGGLGLSRTADSVIRKLWESGEVSNRGFGIDDSKGYDSNIVHLGGIIENKFPKR